MVNGGAGEFIRLRALSSGFFGHEPIVALNGEWAEFGGLSFSHFSFLISWAGLAPNSNSC